MLSPLVPASSPSDHLGKRFVRLPMLSPSLPALLNSSLSCRCCSSSLSLLAAALSLSLSTFGSLLPPSSLCLLRSFSQSSVQLMWGCARQLSPDDFSVGSYDCCQRYSLPITRRSLLAFSLEKTVKRVGKSEGKNK